jgi:hypothetical protein
VTGTAVIVSGPLVRYLRSGLKRELSASLAVLTVAIETTLDPEAYRAAAKRFDDARALFELIGIADRPDQPDIEIDLASSPRLLLRALESQHTLERQRLEDAAFDGIQLPERDVPALAVLVSDIRAKTGIYPSRGRSSLTFLEGSLRVWVRRRRWRGDRR